MYPELNPERENEIIDNIAQFIVKSDLSVPSILFFGSFKSLAWLGGRYALLFIEPFLPFYEKEGREIIEALGEIDNIELLINRIEELTEQKQNDKTKEVNKKNKLINYIMKKIIK